MCCYCRDWEMVTRLTQKKVAIIGNVFARSAAAEEHPSNKITEHYFEKNGWVIVKENTAVCSN